MSITDKIVRNTAYNIVGRFWGSIVGIIIIPYIIGHIGVERFGVWSIVGVVTGYFGLLDFGIGTSFMKYVAEFHARKEYSRINRLLSTGFVFYFTLAAAVISLAAFFIDPLFSFLKIPAGLLGETKFVFFIAIIIFSAANAFSPFAAILTGLQRMDISNLIGLFSSILGIAGTVFVIENGWGLRGLIINNAVILCVSSIITVIYACKIFPELRFNPFALDKPLLGDLFNFGYKLQISRLANLVSFQTDKILVTYFLGIGSVTFYQLGSAVTQQVRQLVLLSVSAFVPAVSEMEVKDGKKGLREFYLIGSKYLVMISIPLTFFLMADASLIIRAWMGWGYDLAIKVILILAPGYCATTISGVASSIAVGVARTDLDMKFGVFMAVLNLILSIALVIKIGFIGIAVGSSVSMVLATVYYFKLFHRYLGSPLQEFIRLLYKPVAGSLIACAAIILFNTICLHFFRSPGRLINAGISVSGFVLFCLGYGWYLLQGDYLNDYDRSLFSSRMPVLKRLLIKK
jgi:O-antigen/teichoic acid export membrane protein